MQKGRNNVVRRGLEVLVQVERRGVLNAQRVDDARAVRVPQAVLIAPGAVGREVEAKLRPSLPLRLMKSLLT